MKKYPLSRIFGLMAVVSLFGFGCSSSGPSGSPTKVSGPTPATFENLSAKDAARKINLVSPNVIVLRQTFTGPGAKIATEAGWGSDAMTTVVIRGFAPKNQADIEWKRETSLVTKDDKGAEKTQERQYTGTVLKANLLSAHGLLSPTSWREGERDALGTGVLWLSQDAYENFTRSKLGTFTFDITEKDFVHAVSGTAYAAGLVDLTKRANAVQNTDIYLAKAEDPSEWTLKLNGVDTKVQVIKVTSWFGSFVFLDNPQNPLILQVRTDATHMGSLAGLFDYDVSELKDLLQ